VYTRVSGISMYVYMGVTILGDWVWIYIRVCVMVRAHTRIYGFNYFYVTATTIVSIYINYRKGKTIKLEFKWAPNNRASDMNR
jgi:hypothetical protein